MRRNLLLGLALITVMTALTAFSGTATARAGQPVDDQPCGAPYQHPKYGTVQKCPLWRGNVPVLAQPQQTGEIVGYLVNGGSANWFICQAVFPDTPYHDDPYDNDWYAFTVADNGEYGWVPEVYFSGGVDYLEDGRLAKC